MYPLKFNLQHLSRIVWADGVANMPNQGTTVYDETRCLLRLSFSVSVGYVIFSNNVPKVHATNKKNVAQYIALIGGLESSTKATMPSILYCNCHRITMRCCAQRPHSPTLALVAALTTLRRLSPVCCAKAEDGESDQAVGGGVLRLP